MSETTNSTDMAADLAGRVTGPVHAPGTDAYDEARTGMQLLDRHRPDAVVEAADAEDVRAAVAWAAERGLPVSAQLTGHGLGAGMEGGVLVATRRMDGVRVAPDRRTAWVEAGATWRTVAEAAAPHGLAPLSGSAPGVGAVSYTLGGGVGLLARRYGFAADHVRRVDMVTADGRPRQVTEESEPDLFWAVRGGGAGAFGLVTGVEIGLFPVLRIYGGSLYLDMAAEPGALEAWRRWTGSVPDELTSGVSVMVYPDMDGLPEELRGRQVAQVSVAWSGPPEEGPKVVEPLRSAAPVLLDTMREMPYTESGAVFDEHHDQAGFRGRSVLVDRLDDGALAELIRMTGSAPFFCVVSLRHLGGALAREPEVANAVGHRGAAYALTVMTFADPDDTGAMRDLREEAAALFGEDAVGRSFTLGFGPMEESEVREVFDPHDYARLTRVRAEYDPTGVLHSNRPIPPKR
ncbi:MULTISPECIES: FAD-binding oxidoreductase [Nocardiopsis]|uniref:FAD-binding protein n=1 Tax=Nocardiopsis sinuspersici TaxID=501010 RepID=A0A1V3C111_9ACTN|nr:MULTISPECIES: FAD-binding oxidoreductase [Nocardiopsis]OOC54497.1 FAD-binding protein [Nocardiopsis sinuspersici]